MNPSYHRPKSIQQALQLKAELGPKAVFLAGGTEVNNRLSFRPEALIDLAGLGLDGIEAGEDGLRIGAGVSFQRLVEHPETPWYIRTAALQMANRNIRNRATVGGQLGANRSCADLIPALLAAQARVGLVDRELPVEQYLSGQPELIVSILLPSSKRGFGVNHMSRTASDVSIVGTAASLEVRNGCITNAILAVGGVAPHVVRLHEVERQLEGKPLPPPEQVEELIAGAVNPIDDLRGTAAYKKHIAAVLGQRALSAAVRQSLSNEGDR